MNNNEELVTQLRSFSQAYPEDMFRPLTKEDVDVVQKAYPGYTDRNSAAMGRPCAKFMEQAAVEIECLEHERGQLAEAIRNAAVKAGIVREDADLTGPHLLMLCNDLADSSLSNKPTAN